MKKLARFVIFFSLTFVTLFIILCLFRFLSFWVDSVQVISQNTERAEALITAARTALPAALFITILLTLSFFSKLKIPALAGIFMIVLLSGVFYLCFTLVIERTRAFDPVLEIPDSLNRRTGTILSQMDTDIIFLGSEREYDRASGFPRVISFPEQPLLYQETALGSGNTVFSLEFDNSPPWFIQSIFIDFMIITREIEYRFNENLFSFLLYGLAFFFLLACFGFLFNSSSWPLANLFISALVFRFILSFAVFLTARDVNTFLVSFVNSRIPDFLITPIIFCIIGTLVILFVFLTFLTRQIRSNDE
jgi:hypothetical protein